MSGLLGPVTANQQMLAQALKAREQPRKQLTGQGLLDVAASGLGPVPIVGDAMGLLADSSRFINEPESRTPLNFGLAALGLLPLVPSGISKAANKMDLTGYHGTHQPDIEQFDRMAGPAKRQGMNTINEIGSWFSASKDDAKKFGPNVLERKLSFENPLVVNNIDEFVRKWGFSQRDMMVGSKAKDWEWKSGKGDPEKFRQYLSNLGYDGVVIKGGEYGNDYYVALDPLKQVKK